ncbi:MAG: HAD hydrolase-like protein [Casimicrobiaceae bacterium]|nr:HAD hydrolase-like protein [Casimicrobiaceae bacterium]MCX8097714.1 HAD hydrolase-like protein [Casimicrobiaceae bacterium]MDW8313141.1 HAD hydrolase-like protein [Burkholderiales bacterium]
MSVTTLFFDLDGTVSDNLVGIHRCLNYAFERLGLEAIDEATARTMIGPPFRVSLPRLYPRIDVEAALRHYRERYAAVGWRENALYQGIEEALRRLHLYGYTLALCTSKPRSFAVRIVEHFGLARYFDGVYGAEFDGRFDRKDELLGHLIGVYGTPPACAVMIGDRGHDVMAAKAHGVRSIGVTWGFGAVEELRTAGADELVTDPSALVYRINALR